MPPTGPPLHSGGPQKPYQLAGVPPVSFLCTCTCSVLLWTPSCILSITTCRWVCITTLIMRKSLLLCCSVCARLVGQIGVKAPWHQTCKLQPDSHHVYRISDIRAWRVDSLHDEYGCWKRSSVIPKPPEPADCPRLCWGVCTRHFWLESRCLETINIIIYNDQVSRCVQHAASPLFLVLGEPVPTIRKSPVMNVWTCRRLVKYSNGRSWVFSWGGSHCVWLQAPLTFQFF